MNRAKTRVIKFLLLISLIAVIIYVARFTDLPMYLLDKDFVTEKVEGYGMFGPLAFLILYIIATVFFIPGTPLTLLAGALFGVGLGTLYTVIGATIGAILAFVFARYLGRGFVEDILDKKFKGLKKYDDSLDKQGFVFTLFLRLIPIFPFNGLNYGLGLTKVKSKYYTLGTLIGIIPGSFVLAYLGDSLFSLDVRNIVIAVALFLVLAFSWPIYRYFNKKKIPRELKAEAEFEESFEKGK